MTPQKDSVRDDWDAAPCGTNDTKDLPELGLAAMAST